MKKLLLIISLFLIVILMLEFFPNLSGEYIMSGRLYINEIMASNYSTILDDDGEYSDYIEIYNGYNKVINLNNYYLSDEEFDIKKWKFPNVEIRPNEYLIIYASDKDKCNLKQNICHTNFKLSSRGEVITLTDSSGNIISKITYPELGSDISYGYKNKKYIMFDKATPREKNTSEELKKIKGKNYSNIIINEYMTDNKRSHYDTYGNYYDWLELYNDSNEDVILTNLFITDDETNLNKCKVKETRISKKGYLIIYLVGSKVSYDEAVYCDFALSTNDKKIILSDGKKIIDEVKIVSLKENISYGRIDKKWKYFTTSTPGYENTTKSFDNLGGIYGES